MSNKHTVMTDALVTIGTIHKVEEGTRDAVHIAARVCVAGQTLTPGMRVGRLLNGKYGPHASNIVGIVDPFLSPHTFILEDQVFWLLVLPRTITSLQHVWKHPDFPEEKLQEVIKPELIAPAPMSAIKVINDRVIAQAAPSRVIDIPPPAPPVKTLLMEKDEIRITRERDAKAYLEQIAGEHDLSYDELYAGTVDWVNNENYFYHPRDRGYFEGIGVTDEDFWKSFEILSGKIVPENLRYDFFTCSC